MGCTAECESRPVKRSLVDCFPKAQLIATGLASVTVVHLLAEMHGKDIALAI